MIKRDLSLLIHRCKIVQSSRQDLLVIVVYDPAATNCYDVIKTAPFVHTKTKGATHHLVSEGEFHFISISKLNRAGLDTLPGKLAVLSVHGRPNERFDLLLF